MALSPLFFCFSATINLSFFLWYFAFSARSPTRPPVVSSVRGGRQGHAVFSFSSSFVSSSCYLQVFSLYGIVQLSLTCANLISNEKHIELSHMLVHITVIFDAVHTHIYEPALSISSFLNKMLLISGLYSTTITLRCANSTIAHGTCTHTHI
jgi:hypothetical protein